VVLARNNIQTAVLQALIQAEVKKGDIAYAVFGLAGADREPDFQILRPMIAKLGFESYDIVCDTVIGLRAGTKQSDGVVVICGSGTNSFGVSGCSTKNSSDWWWINQAGDNWRWRIIRL
jgi:N-acetylglucosamine kinase-like BadF-type ATPase